MRGHTLGRVITTNDYVAIRAMVEEMLPQDEVEKFYKYMSRIGNSMFPMFGSGALFNEDIVRKNAIIFSSTLKMENHSSIKPLELRGFPYLISRRDAETIYQELTTDCQRFFIDLKEVYEDDVAYVYLKLLRRIGRPPVVRLLDVQDSGFYQYMTKERTHQAVKDFINALKNSAINSNDDGFDYSFPSDEFIETVRQEARLWESLQESKAELLFLMRTVYGESTVLDFVRTVGLDQTGITHCDQILDIIDDWSNLKHYPIDWILTMLPNNIS